MKILMVNNYHYMRGGSEAVYFNTAELLRQEGHEVFFFSQKDEKNVPCDQMDYFPENAERKNLPARIASYFYNREASRNLDCFLSEHKIDIAHIHLLWGGLSPSILRTLKRHRIPIVHTAHDYRIICPASTFRTPDGKLCDRCRKGNFVTCLTHRCAKGNVLFSFVMMLEMFFRCRFFHPGKMFSGIVYVSRFSQNLHLVRDGRLATLRNIVQYNFSAMKALTTPRTGKSKQYNIYCGRLSPEKGLLPLLEVYAELPDMRLKIVGTGPQQEELENFCRERSMQNVEFSGFRQGKELWELINGADYLILPSVCYENNPMTVIEAYSLGLPVIATALGGFLELVSHGDNGFLFPFPPEKHQMMEIIKHAESLPDSEYSRMSSRALSFYNEKFTPSQYCTNLVQFYREVASSQAEK
jgi:glycosyltransferase involved in cell wall biosynthesis